MKAGWRNVRRLLCVRLDSLGDVLMCTPAMRALKEGLPGSRLTLLSSDAGAQLAPLIPEIDAVLRFAAPWMKHGSGSSRVDGDKGEEDHGVSRCVEALRRQAFDAAVIFTSCSQSALPAALLCLQAGIPLRLAICRENPYALLSDWIPETERVHPSRHEVQRQLDLVGAIGCAPHDSRLSFLVPDAATAAVTRRLAAAGINPALPLVVLHPGASAPSRRYPARHWPPLMRQLAARTRCQLVLTGSDAEREMIAVLLDSGPRAWSFAGQLDLGELGALIARAALVVANNTGPAHIAAALGTPVVSLYAMTNPQHTPWRVAQRVLFHPVPCRNCLRSVCPQEHHGCLELLEPETVAAAAAALLAVTRHGPSDTSEGGLAYT